mmetsp:Transcript_71735/g.134158  ORF Transcript_71735/g.134158 Transcript_71735/m.134158 type:complete len:408 (+) Transcript_71735:162-1385(+)
MSWMKGTEWTWNRGDFTLKFERDGDLSAPIQQCQGGCKWSADNGKVYLLLGSAGVAEFSTESKKPANMAGMRMKGQLKADGQRVTLTYERIFDHEAVDLDKDLYGALGLADDADEAAIKKAYRSQSVKYHPDKNPDEASRLKFAEIRDAYEILNDPDKKILYDTGGMDAVQKAAKGDVQKTNDFETGLEVTLQELYLGGEKHVKVNRRVVCRGCRLKPNAPQCRGCGKCPNEVRVQNVQVGPFMTQQQQEVPSKEKCKQENTPIVANIERGMADGDRLTFARMADQRPGMLPGSVILKLKSAEHKKFRRRGNDLHMDMTVTLREALLGWTQTIRHIDGHTVEIKSNKVTKDLQIITVRGEGMPLRDDPASFGDLHVKVRVIFPKTLTAEQREAIAKVFPVTPPRDEL